jgi:hypothetical protein
MIFIDLLGLFPSSQSVTSPEGNLRCIILDLGIPNLSQYFFLLLLLISLLSDDRVSQWIPVAQAGFKLIIPLPTLPEC